MGVGKTNKRKGSNAERLYARLFKELGFSHCVTARYGSRIHDDAGIDLINLPFNVQVKAGKQKGMNISNVLEDIKGRMPTYFPETAPEHDYPLILIHRKDVGRGKRRGEFDDIVSMSFEDFKNIIEKIKEWD